MAHVGDSYSNLVKKASRANRDFIPGIWHVLNRKGGMRPGWHIDHIVPIWYGERMDIPVEEMASLDNLQILSMADKNPKT